MSSHYGKIKMKSGNDILFETKELVEEGRVSSGGIVTRLQGNFEDIIKVIKETAESAHDGLQNIENAAKPNEYEISFGLKLNANAGVVFAQAGSEGSFQITLKWTKSNCARPPRPKGRGMLRAARPG